MGLPNQVPTKEFSWEELSASHLLRRKFSLPRMDPRVPNELLYQPDESSRLKASGNFSFVEVYKLVGYSHSYTYIDVGHILNPREHATQEYLLEFVTDIVVEQARYLLLMDIYFKRKILGFYITILNESYFKFLCCYFLSCTLQVEIFLRTQLIFFGFQVCYRVV